MASSDLVIALRAVDEASKVIRHVEGNLSGMGTTVATVGKVALAGGAAVGAAIAGIGVASVGLAMDFEKTMSGIKAVSGATSTEMEGLTTLALQLGKDTVFSAKEAAAGIEELIKGGIPIADIMGGAAAATLNLATAGGVNLTDAAEIASNAMAMFGLKGRDMENVANQIAGAANASSLSVTDFKFSLSMAGAVANLAGQSFDSTAQGIAILGKMGLKGSDAGTSLKTMLMNLLPTTKAQNDAFAQLGLNTGMLGNAFLNADGSFRQLNEIAGILHTATTGLSDSQKTLALEAIFGSDAIRAAAIMAEAGAEGFATMAEEMSKVTAASVAAERLNNLSGDLEQLKGSVETAGIMIGVMLTPTIREMTQEITGITNKVIGFMDDGLDPLDAMLFAVRETIASKFGPDAAEAFENVTRVGGDMFSALGSGIRWVADNILPALIRAGQEMARDLGQNFSDLGTKVREIGEFFSALGSTATGVIDWIGGRISWVGERFSDLGSLARDLGNAFDWWIANVARNAVSNLLNRIGDLINGIRNIPVPHLPGFAAGGIVPGMAGTSMLAVVHGGERITPRGGGVEGSRTAGGAQSVNITIELDGQIVGRAVWDYLKQQNRRGATMGLT